MSEQIHSAFPVLERGGSGLECTDPGMTLRDYFAAQAMSAGISFGSDKTMRGYEGWRMEFALESYRYADAMLAAREVKA